MCLSATMHNVANEYLQFTIEPQNLCSLENRLFRGSIDFDLAYLVFKVYWNI